MTLRLASEGRPRQRFLICQRFFVFGAVGLILFHPAHAAVLCSGMPPSRLQIYDIKAPVAQEMAVDALDGVRRDGVLVSRHTLMLTMSDLVVAFNIKHWMVTQANGTVCDAPSFVRIGFGSSRRIALYERAAVADSCVRQKMQEHEAYHARTLNDVVDRFIDAQQEQLERGMTALKQTPAPNAAIAKARWEAGLNAILNKVKEQLLVDIQIANIPVDAPAVLDALENACEGKIRQITFNAGPLRVRPLTSP